MEQRPELIEDARDALAGHNYPATDLEFIGAGAQSACFGVGDVAVLLSLGDDTTPQDLLGHVVPYGAETIVRNSYPTIRWITSRAAAAGVRTPRILDVGDHPRPHAVIERAKGTLATAHPSLSDHEVGWYEQLGAQIRTTNQITTTGFGIFTTDGSGTPVGRYPSWPAFLDDWLRVYLCVGDSRPEDARVLDFLLSQRIVTERDLATVAMKIKQAAAWTVDSVLTHYDNRLDNLVINGDTVTILDWDLSCAGIGIHQEMIKLFESGSMTLANPRVAAFLHGYGLSDRESEEAINGGKLMLVMDGLAMSHGWADQTRRHGAVRGWLQTIKKVSSSW